MRVSERCAPMGVQRGLLLYAAALVLLPLAATAAQVQMNASLGQPVLGADKKQVTYLKVGLTGFALERASEHTPVNVALVLDRSGSMEGEKLRKAKEAAINILDRLNPNDILSVVVFDNTVSVIVPATKLTDKAMVRAEIEKIQPGNTTAIFAGVCKGADEVRKFFERERANRIILLSDGEANVGPSSPTELGSLGYSLRKEGIAVTTIGLGQDYNEDLMTHLARRSDANHYFVNNADDLPRILNTEFGSVLAVVAQEVSIKITCAEGIRPVRLLGRDGEINGQDVYVQLNQLYGSQEKFALLEVEVPPTAEGTIRAIAQVNVGYFNMSTRVTDKLAANLTASFTRSTEVIEKSELKPVMVDVVKLVANEKNKEATKLRDEGRVEDAKQALTSNAAFLRAKAAEYKAPVLYDYAVTNDEDIIGVGGAPADSPSGGAIEGMGRGAGEGAFARVGTNPSSGPNWNAARKDMRARQNALDQQQLTK